MTSVTFSGIVMSPIGRTPVAFPSSASCRVLHDDVVAEDRMWRQLLYLVCVVEAAPLATVLFVLVIDPEYALAPRMRQVGAIGLLVLGGRSCYAVGRFLLGTVSGHRWLHR
jgi:hypothetical protein